MAISLQAMGRSAKKPKRFAPLHALVVVEWDAAWKNDSFDPEHTPLRLYQTGFVIQHDAKGITLVTERGEREGYYRSTHFTPSGMIGKVSELKWKPSNSD